MWELNYKESWAPKSWCFWTVVLEKTLESPLDCKEIQPVHSKDQSWVFIGRTDVEAETPILWPPDVKSWLIWKDPDAGKDWGQEEKGMTEDEMVGWHHWLNGHEFVWTPGVGDGRGGLACCSSWGRRVGRWLSDWTELNRNKLPYLTSLSFPFFICKRCCRVSISRIFDSASAAAKLLQSCMTLCDPIDGSPPGSSVHGIFQAKVLECIAIAFSLDSWVMQIN